MTPSFKVLIAGAGIGGATLAILLERARIDYELFESAPDVTSIGGAVIVLGPTVMPLFEQLGLLPRLMDVSKIVNTLHLNQDNMKRIGEIDLSDHKDQTGYNSVVVARPDLLSILIAQIPARKIHFSKRIVSFTANKNDVIVRCQDDTTFKGQLLVGADGAFSTVREVLYKHMAKKGILPRADAAAVAVDSQHQHAIGQYTAWMGISEPLDVNVEQFSALKEQDARCDIVLGDNVPYSWSYYTVPGNRICWTVNVHTGNKSSTSSSSRNDSPSTSRSPSPPLPSSISTLSSSSTEACSPGQEKVTAGISGWETNSDVPDECRSFVLPMGGTLNDLIDVTPKESISRVMIDARLFETWHHGRTVLIGDACHRMLPNTAHQGAVNVIHDAVALANLIHDLPSASAENLVVLFKEFHALRYSLIKTQMQMDRKASKMLRGQSWTESLMRKLLVRYMSKVYQHFGNAKVLANRPQATFMPLINSRGNITALPQMEHKVFGGDGQSKH